LLREDAPPGGAAKFVAADAFKKIGGQLVRLEKFFEGQVRVDARGDDVGGEFFTILKGNATGTAVLCENFANGRFGADFDAGFARGIRDGVRNGAGASAAETPRAESAVDFSHVVVKEDIGGAG